MTTQYHDEIIEKGVNLHESNINIHNDRDFNIEYDDIKSIYEEEEEEEELISYSEHFALQNFNNNVDNLNTRDFHKIIIDLYNIIPFDEKMNKNNNNQLVVKLNSLIMSWHSMAPELWNHHKYGIWAKLCHFCSQRFTKDKYPEIFNLVCCST